MPSFIDGAIILLIQDELWRTADRGVFPVNVEMTVQLTRWNVIKRWTGSTFEDEPGTDMIQIMAGIL